MANQAFSLSEDLMVGAGEVLFKRADDTNGWHTFGNCDEMNITVDVTKVEKNSSLNRKRTLMQSVTTAVKPTTTITLTEYNAYNLALGLYGTESVTHVDAKDVVDELYTVVSVPGVITLVDADGNRVFNAKDIVIKPETAIPAMASFVSVPSSLGTMATTASKNDTLNDVAGGKLTINAGTYSALTDTRIFMTIKTAPTSTGDLDGMEVEVKEGVAGVAQTFTVTGTKLTDTFTLTSGATITATVTSSDTFTKTNAGATIEARVDASTTAYTKGRDYFYDTQSASAGVIKFNVGSAISAGDRVKVSYHIDEANLINVSLADAGDIEGEFLYIGDNNSGPNYVVEGWRVKVSPSGDVSGLISSDFSSFQLELSFLDDSEHHPEYPFARVTATSRSGDTSEAKTGTYHPEW